MRFPSRAFYLATLYTFLYLPIMVVVFFSFNNASHSLLWHGFTWKWYIQLFHNDELGLVAYHSLVIGTLAASCATAIGTLAAVSLFRYEFAGKKSLNQMIFMLIIIPDLVLGISLLLLFRTLNISPGFWTLLIAHITFCIPFTCVTIGGRINLLNRSIIEAAGDLGATEFILFRKIIVPLLLPAILASWLLSFTLSLDDVVISYFVSGPSYEILPLAIFSMVKLGVKPEVNALCSVMIAFTLVIVIIAQQALGKKQ